jgi:nitrogen fixation NifU-like protein
MLTEEVLGQRLEDLADTTRDDILDMLGVEVSYARMKCATLSLGLLRLALAEAGVSIADHLEDED